MQGGGEGFDWHRMLFDYPPLKLPNLAFRNRGDLTFEDASKRWRFDLGDDISHGMALADLDGDGDLDVVINRLNMPAAVLRNDARRRASRFGCAGTPRTRLESGAGSACWVDRCRCSSGRSSPGARICRAP